ncbi:hypothetical protein CONPUDRAFT_168246 [Coniophora puteana RWD-64-598 SS2]|uniref:tRNA-guanine(15) transglycosylase-like domain-containing protein n=1 Tax=Coniophora puteana (strain RWD-64-598) TaxID=741705 RepID=A0A5M3MFA4_CONPW|nr:uncharacterized protein CONPUDRAFT_168246 [Coniophora puteana RWD-64-598 SS2]EIW77271.1 hypothetical protein CONPUDRAFT_168246 [Coniophora puteana RWD-64-598 SS2]
MAQDKHPSRASENMRLPSLRFHLASPLPSGALFGPRLGTLTLHRYDGAGRNTNANTDPADSDGSANAAEEEGTQIELPTPGFLVCTSRGVVPHLSRDHCNAASAVHWVHVPFESFLDNSPPVPTLQGGDTPLHSFLGFDKAKHVVSMSIRDPHDVREMPPNGPKHLTAKCVRGVRKVTLDDWRRYTSATRPDIVFALSDTPFTPPPYSQKRLTKSIERSAEWLADLLRPGSTATQPQDSQSTHPLNVFVNMAGGHAIAAREAFAHGLVERLYGKDAEVVKPLKRLDDGVCGYAFDLAPLRHAAPLPVAAMAPDAAENDEVSKALDEVTDKLGATSLITENAVAALKEAPTPNPLPSSATQVIPPQSNDVSHHSSRAETSLHELLRASLEPLLPQKPRLATGSQLPHEVLALIIDVGIDVFDATWAVQAAGWGVALDFKFPVPTSAPPHSQPQTHDHDHDFNRDQSMLSLGGGLVREDGKRDIGHDLYADRYANDFSRFADCFAARCDSTNTKNIVAAVDLAGEETQPTCPCIACSPRTPRRHTIHSKVDFHSYPAASEGGGEENAESKRHEEYRPPFTRAYLHHLLHTHEMSAHTVLVAHNLAVLDAFFAGIRSVLGCGGRAGEQVDGDDHGRSSEAFEETADRFWQEVRRFTEVYSGSMALFEEARSHWGSVDYARGKGRLTREREVQSTPGSDIA